MVKYLISKVETYRVDKEHEAVDSIEEEKIIIIICKENIQVNIKKKIQKVK